MSNENKSILIAGMTFNVLFFVCMLSQVFILNSAAYALFAALATYLFFNNYFFEESKQQEE
ncbi:DUF1270 family protein [Staphylococcus hominis]|uniref:DUF1270 family protein n=1 Tax=Staphylococcus hominis TaxID=1290 RepID=A0A974KXH7_STAHO|nr:DUF1270 family protein [Staphylococcus hominis]PTK30795.1 hypothetical protein BUZ51_06145 [Staphylococcus hominis]RIO57495.1 DUF1270 family protein [Staphylococcus hominis]